jgi:hypothetical protein
MVIAVMTVSGEAHILGLVDQYSVHDPSFTLPLAPLASGWYE